MGISTRSDSDRAPPNTADSDPARSTQTRESIVAFKLPSYSGGLSLPESRATSGRIRTYGTYVSRRALRCILTVYNTSVSVFHEKEKKGGKKKMDPEARSPGGAERSGGWPGRTQDTRSVWRQERFNLLDSTRVWRESEPVRKASTRFNLGIWWRCQTRRDGRTNGWTMPPSLSGACRDRHCGRGGNTSSRSGFRYAVTLSRVFRWFRRWFTSLRHPLCRHYCHCTLGSVVLCSFPGCRLPRVLRFASWRCRCRCPCRLGHWQPAAMFPVVSGHEISGTHVKKKGRS